MYVAASHHRELRPPLRLKASVTMATFAAVPASSLAMRSREVPMACRGGTFVWHFGDFLELLSVVVAEVGTSGEWQGVC